MTLAEFMVTAVIAAGQNSEMCRKKRGDYVPAGRPDGT